MAHVGASTYLIEACELHDSRYLLTCTRFLATPKGVREINVLRRGQCVLEELGSIWEDQDEHSGAGAEEYTLLSLPSPPDAVVRLF